MKVAIIGTGFAGLSVAWHLVSGRPSCQVILFDSKGIGGGASGVAAGLIHPYVGKSGRRSHLATEGLEEAKKLFDIAQGYVDGPIFNPGGILRSTERGSPHFFDAHVDVFGDVIPSGPDSFVIKSGMTVDCPRYLRGLWGAIEAKGGRFIQEKISNITQLKEFDQIVVAAGAGIQGLVSADALKVSFIKGQVLITQPLVNQSIVGNGYLAATPLFCAIGATYEREFVNDLPDISQAKMLLLPKVASLLPMERLEIRECKAGVRVVPRGHYFPIQRRLGENVWVVTGLGSRGLLYHGLLGRQLAGAILDIL